jgi:hypothetical protein
VSVTIWGALLVLGGTAVRDVVSAQVDWLDSGNVVLSTTDLGEGEAPGSVMSGKSLAPPEDAVTARVVVSGAVTSWSAGAVLAFYADALGVTTP